MKISLLCVTRWWDQGRQWVCLRPICLCHLTDFPGPTSEKKHSFHLVSHEWAYWGTLWIIHLLGLTGGKKGWLTLFLDTVIYALITSLPSGEFLLLSQWRSWGQLCVGHHIFFTNSSMLQSWLVQLKRQELASSLSVFLMCDSIPKTMNVEGWQNGGWRSQGVHRIVPTVSELTLV